MKHKVHIYPIMVLFCISIMLFLDMKGVQAMCVHELMTVNNEKNIINDSITVNVQDSIISLEQDDKVAQKIKELESPVDTAMISLKSDSILNEKEKKPVKRWIPDSNKSLWMAMVLPGAGQIYNRKYWKLPIIYGGFVGCAYALTWNTKMYNDYSQAYQDIMSDNPNNDSYKDFIPPYVDIESNLEYYQNTFKNAKDIYRRQRDLSIFAFIGVYLLSVIDAYVDAELSDFDISKDLSLKLEPTLFNDILRNRPQGIGLQCNIKF